MTTFKKDDKLKAINIEPLEGNDIAPPLVEGETYTVTEVYVCKCGQDHVNVGLKSRYNWVNCYKCKTPIPTGDISHWCHPTRFEAVV